MYNNGNSLPSQYIQVDSFLKLPLRPLTLPITALVQTIRYYAVMSAWVSELSEWVEWVSAAFFSHFFCLSPVMKQINSETRTKAATFLWIFRDVFFFPYLGRWHMRGHLRAVFPSPGPAFPWIPGLAWLLKCLP